MSEQSIIGDKDIRGMVRRLGPGLLWLALTCFCLPELLYGQKTVNFNRDIRPLLSDRCFLCHGPDEAARQADLRLDNFAAATQDAIVPGNADASKLIERITSADPEVVMPTPESHKSRLTAEQVELFRNWINAGAQYEAHWAFVPPQQADLPAAPGTRGERNSIDHFVRGHLRQLGLEPAPPADRATLLRRLTFDLTGLPPSPHEVRKFLADTSPGALERVVDRLLASDAYGEHMARYWLDAARYADSNGYQYDFAREQWAWRDWVIHAFNQNMPFDQFTIEQLAGDLLPNSTDQQKLATGFNRNHPITVEGGIIDEEYRTEYVIDRVVTTGTVWLGATFICSRCHDHKYDPTTQRDFYQIYDFFNQVPDKGMQGFAPQAEIVSPLQAPRIEAAELVVSQANEQFLADYSGWEQAAVLEQRYASDDQPAAWKTPAPVTLSSEGAARLTLGEDGSIFVDGTVPKQDTYVLEYELVDQTIGAIRLEALTDPRLPGRGASLSENSNFVLTEFTLETAESAGNGDYQSRKIAEATADYAQRNYPIAAAIDGQLAGGGWAVDGNDRSQRVDHQAVFVLAAPMEVSTQPIRLRVKLHFKSSFAQHAIGKFRLSFSPQPDPLTSAEVLAAMQVPAAARSAEQQRLVARHVVGVSKDERMQPSLQRLITAEKELEELRKSTPKTMIMQDEPARRESFILVRGEYDKPSDKVSADTPGYLPPLPADAPRNRLGFARWLVSPENPLTARVAVNRFWMQFFGLGLVDTPEDFGLQGNAPSHPELLDWLAVDFVQSGWDVRHLIKTIVLSKTYQQSSAITPESYARDPENRWLSRGPRMRLDAESVRDAALAVSGLLHRKVGGPSVYPYHPEGLWTEMNNRPGFSTDYNQDHGANLYRRSLYTFWKRTVTPPSMAVFDAPNRETCLVRRSRTNTPLQAFVLLHDPQFVEAARKLAERMLLEGGPQLDEQLRFGFLTSLGRYPTADELDVLREAYQADFDEFSKQPQKGKAILQVGESAVSPQLDFSQLAAMTNVARLLMNLSEFVTRG